MEQYKHPCDRYYELESIKSTRSLTSLERDEYLAHVSNCPTGEHLVEKILDTNPKLGESKLEKNAREAALNILASLFFDKKEGKYVLNELGKEVAKEVKRKEDGK